ncbi:uncharacterized protein FOMMEDRAFT_122500 [Fomitiporia mediterranea MF3/22]|uniref:uncharacterized protein n=1 Tax=Fomitiporia mediterranea (strain MF3/22) TaxID=694068 RepID=UPI0004407800|nr:uncharacterized protein FOMMEDRAFT_122500 [Fomitiporia mediterranea MF3/22]EJD04632.1 hypothetical protein FOMMEDRAFT_122500 [Fomitiporia mediterranea MF3/22]
MINRFNIYDKLGAPQPFDPNASFTTSPFLSPFALAAVRLTFAFYTLFTLIFVLVWDAVRLHTAHAFFSYFTELSYIGLCSYFFASGVQTLVYALSQGRSYPLERWPKILQFLHVLLFTTISTFPILVTIVFWGALFPGNPFTDKFDAWSNVSLHALNTVFSLFEILFTHAGPTPWLHIPFVVIFLGCYLAVAYITHATQGFYTYSFLNPAKEGKTLAGWIVGIAAAGVIIFCITRSICVLRERLVRRSSVSRFSDAGDTELPNERLDEWETVELDRSTRMGARVEKGGVRGKKSVESHLHSGEGGDTSFETDEKAGMRMNLGRRRNELV